MDTQTPSGSARVVPRPVLRAVRALATAVAALHGPWTRARNVLSNLRTPIAHFDYKDEVPLGFWRWPFYIVWGSQWSERYNAAARMLRRFGLLFFVAVVICGWMWLSSFGRGLCAPIADGECAELHRVDAMSVWARIFNFPTSTVLCFRGGYYMINPQIVALGGDVVLSRETFAWCGGAAFLVPRRSEVRISYYDPVWRQSVANWTLIGDLARCAQHMLHGVTSCADHTIIRRVNQDGVEK